jgi:uncharacterized protein (DUF2126 family)
VLRQCEPGSRADESVRERFDELPIALEDATGCSHRAEINIEKLWDPWRQERGQLGLRLKLDDAALEVRPAVSFWPLIGDLAAQEARGARMVDSSASRVHLLVSAAPGAAVGRIAANGWRVPMQGLSGGAGARAIGSVVYRAFVPRPGLHPNIPANDPLVIEWQRGDSCVRVDLYSWQPGGGSYSGLPVDQAEARARRGERVVITSLSKPSEMRVTEAAGTTLDLRRLRA